MGLFSLPAEILVAVVKELEPVDHFNLALACPQLQFLIRDDGLCHYSLKRHARFSPEFREAERDVGPDPVADGTFARALRRHAKRKLALQTASPFSVSIVAYAYTFMSKNGLLAYTTDSHKLRILRLEGNISDEMVVDVRKLVHSIMPDFRALNMQHLCPVHYSHGVISCVLRFNYVAAGAGWLFFWAIDRPAETLKAHHLGQIGKLFVRNNSSYLYCGVAEPNGWCLRGFDLKTRGIIAHIPLPDFRGMVVGHNAAFEIIDDYLYGVSSVGAPGDDTDLVHSYYYAFRRKLGPDQEFQVLPNDMCWRMNKQDTACDDRWSTLDLIQDERTGEAILYETRKILGASSQRLCYRRELGFGFSCLETNVPAVKATVGVDGLQASGDCGSNRYTPTFDNLLARWYSPSARCFVDVDKWSRPDCGTLFGLRVRPKESCQPQSLSSSADRSCCLRGDAIHNQPGVFCWPPEQARSGPCSDMIRVLKVPPNDLHISMDERCIVVSHIYTHSVNLSLSPLRLMCFDPGVRLKSPRREDNSLSLSMPEQGLVASGTLTSHGVDWLFTTQANYVWVLEADGDQKVSSWAGSS